MAKQKLTLDDVPTRLKLSNGRNGTVAVSRFGSRLNYRVTWPGYRGWPAFEVFGKHRTIRALLTALGNLVKQYEHEIKQVTRIQTQSLLYQFADSTSLNFDRLTLLGFKACNAANTEVMSLQGKIHFIPYGNDPRRWRWMATHVDPLDGAEYENTIPYALRPTTVGELRWLCWRLNIKLKEPA